MCSLSNFVKMFVSFSLPACVTATTLLHALLKLKQFVSLPLLEQVLFCCLVTSAFLGLRKSYDFVDYLAISHYQDGSDIILQHFTS